MFDFSEDNVTFVNNFACRTAWPNAQNCVRIDFSIRLKLLPKRTAPNELNQSETADTANSTDILELSRDALIRMWIRFGREEFSDNGFKVHFERVLRFLQLHFFSFIKLFNE